MLRKIMNGDYEFVSPEWDEISDVAKDMVCSLFEALMPFLVEIKIILSCQEIEIITLLVATIINFVSIIIF